MKAFLHLQVNCTHDDQNGVLLILDQILNTPQVLNLWYIQDLKGLTLWANQGGPGVHFFIFKLWLLGVPGPRMRDACAPISSWGMVHRDARGNQALQTFLSNSN